VVIGDRLFLQVSPRLSDYTTKREKKRGEKSEGEKPGEKRTGFKSPGEKGSPKRSIPRGASYMRRGILARRRRPESEEANRLGRRIAAEGRL